MPGMRSYLGVLGLTALLAAGAARAETGALETVRAALRQFSGKAPIHTTLERAVTSDRKDRPLEAGRASLEVSAGPSGISLHYPAELLAQVRAEREETDPEKARPATRTLEGFDAIDVAALLNGATALLSDLDDATVRGDTAVDYQGQPAHLLELDLVVRTSKANRKWLKSTAYTMRLWVAADGTPLAAESEFTFRAGLLIFNFDGKQQEAHSYVRMGDRLVALKYTSRFDGDGLGESTHVWSETTLHVHSGAEP